MTGTNVAGLALAVFMGTLPLLGVLIWNLMELRKIRHEPH